MKQNIIFYFKMLEKDPLVKILKKEKYAKRVLERTRVPGSFSTKTNIRKKLIKIYYCVIFMIRKKTYYKSLKRIELNI